MDRRQQAYLEAMDIPVWVARQQPQAAVDHQASETVAGHATEVVAQQTTEAVGQQPSPAVAQPQPTALAQGLKLGPGSGGILLVCAKDRDSASKLGNDIARVLPNNPVWAWPDNNESAVSPNEAVNENLFTCVAVFGDALAQLLFDKQVPSAIGSAKLVVLPAMSELESSAGARQQLWVEFCRSGMIVG